MKSKKIQPVERNQMLLRPARNYKDSNSTFKKITLTLSNRLFLLLPVPGQFI